MAATASSAATSTTPSISTGVEGYEDMFKEITRKLYGEETGHALGTPIPPIAHLATSGPTLPEGERSFTTLAGNSIDFTNDLNSNTNKDHLFGLAALMQNGFTQAPSSILGSHNFSPSGSKSAIASPSLASHEDISRWNNVVGTSDNCTELLQWNVNQSGGTSKPVSKNGKKDSEAKKTGQGASSSATAATATGVKRYTCSTCPYSTDRRDLYTRHENIHKTEKPFHCFACLKQFNRADHVKKHFMRMHREIPYDINKTRRTVPARTPSTATTVSNPVETATVAPSASTTAPSTQYYNHPQAVTYGSQPVADHQNANNVNAQMNPQHMLHQHLQPPVQHHHTSNGNAAPEQPLNVKVKQEKQSTTVAASANSSPKKKGDKRFVCCYCPWTGADNWGLKRHLNTHTKPYVCMLCDYKAARSERLVTHVYKVHNKKACNKCSFLADDHAQFLAHLSEAHPVDSRSGTAARQGTNSNTEAGGHGHGQSSGVLRAIGNTNSTTLVSGNGAVTHNMAMFSNGFNHSSPETAAWRPAVSNPKRGAERLFQYMEADGSDPEDYQKQLQMTALSRSARNTVAQDFPNAGGGVMTSTKQERNTKKRDSVKPAEIASSLFANQGYQQKFIRDLEEFIVQRLSTSDGTEEPVNGKDKSLITNTPPPAKRRRCSSHDKENYRHGKAPMRSPRIQPDWPSDRGQMNAQMREIFQMITKHYGDQMKVATESASQSVESRKPATRSLEQLEQILKNNRELTISIRDNQAAGGGGCIKYGNGDSGLDDEEEEDEEDEGEETLHKQCDNLKSKRKQFVPRKIGSCDDGPRNNFAIWNSIRDKHLARLMSPKRSCRICVKRQSSLSIPYHTVSSLLLHKQWRHGWKRKLSECDQCEHKFKKPYQLVLHRRLRHT